MKLIITIDTEEDNWGKYSPTGNTIENIAYIRGLQELFDRYGATPTYLISYPVAADDNSVQLLRGIMESGRCEIGTHCHPWNTPPFVEECNARNSMLCNLPSELQFIKIKNLHDMIKNRFGIDPVSFRCGRWGCSEDVLRNLNALGYRIDTSITPYTDWSPYHGPDMSGYTPETFIFPKDCNSHESTLFVVPATVGYLQKDFATSNLIFNLSGSFPFRYLRLRGILDRLRIVNKVWLSPEVSNSDQMIALARTMMKRKEGFLNMVFHSSTLKAGLTPFVRSRADEKMFLKKIEEFLIFTRDSGIKSIKLCEAAN